MLTLNVIILLIAFVLGVHGVEKLSTDIIEKSYFASHLSHAVYDADDYWESKSGGFCNKVSKAMDSNTDCEIVKHPDEYDVTKFKIYTDMKGLDMPQGDDYIALYKWNDVCYAAWRGTDVTDSYFDFVQNAPAIFGFESINGPRGSCMVRRGWKYAFGIDYDVKDDGPHTDDMLDDIRRCTDSCRYGCDLVLTGHSQGGAAAAVAAVALADKNPYLITFGQPGVYKNGKCDVVRSNRTFRFVNTVIASHINKVSGWLWEDSLWYDRTPRLFIDDTFGNLVTLSENNRHRLVTYPDGHRDSSPIGYAPKVTFSAHDIELYVSRIKKIHKSDSNPIIGLNLWNDGEQCYFDSECKGKCTWKDTTEEWWHLPKKGRYECSSSI